MASPRIRAEHDFFGKSKCERHLHWFEYAFLSQDLIRTRVLISHAFVSTHNHFVLDHGGKVFNLEAPVAG